MVIYKLTMGKNAIPSAVAWRRVIMSQSRSTSQSTCFGLIAYFKLSCSHSSFELLSPITIISSPSILFCTMLILSQKVIRRSRRRRGVGMGRLSLVWTDELLVTGFVCVSLSQHTRQLTLQLLQLEEPKQRDIIDFKH